MGFSEGLMDADATPYTAITGLTPKCGNTLYLPIDESEFVLPIVSKENITQE